MPQSRAEFLDALRDTHVVRVEFTYRHTKAVIQLGDQIGSMFKSAFESKSEFITWFSQYLNRYKIEEHDEFGVLKIFTPVQFLKYEGVLDEYKRLQDEFLQQMKNSEEARKRINEQYLNELRYEVESLMDRYLKSRPNVRVPIDDVINETVTVVKSSYARNILKSLGELLTYHISPMNWAPFEFPDESSSRIRLPIFISDHVNISETHKNPHNIEWKSRPSE